MSETETVYRVIFLSQRDGSITGVTPWLSDLPEGRPDHGIIQRMTGTPEVIEGE